jgi:dethiobiotin synthetase
MVENRPLDVASAQDAFQTLSSRHRFVVVEGVGGWRVPLTESLCMSDFAAQLALPVLVVTPNRLGALNHTQLTLDSIEARGSRCVGVVLNEPELREPDAAQITNPGILEHLLSVPVLGQLVYGADTLPATVLENLMSHESLRAVLPS